MARSTRAVYVTLAVLAGMVAVAVAVSPKASLGGLLRGDFAESAGEDESLHPTFYYNDIVSLKSPAPTSTYLYAGTDACDQPRATGSVVVDQMQWQLINPTNPSSKAKIKTNDPVAVRSSFFKRYLTGGGGCNDSDSPMSSNLGSNGAGTTFLWKTEKAVSLQDKKDGEAYVTLEYDQNPGNLPPVKEEDKQYLGVDPNTQNIVLRALATAWEVKVVSAADPIPNNCPPCNANDSNNKGKTYSYKWKYGDVVAINRANLANTCQWWYDNGCNGSDGPSVMSTSNTVGAGEKFVLVNPANVELKGGLIAGDGVIFSPQRNKAVYFSGEKGKCLGTVSQDSSVFDFVKPEGKGDTESAYYDQLNFRQHLATDGVSTRFLYKDPQSHVAMGESAVVWRMYLVKSNADECNCEANEANDNNFSSACVVDA